MAVYVPQTNWSFYVTYDWDYGLRGVPMCGPPGTPMQVIAEQAPVCYKYVSWIAQAMDSQNPQPPDWRTTSNEVLVRKVLSSTFLTELMDGTTANTVAGVYVYLLLVPPSDTDQLGIGYPPWDTTLINAIVPSNFFPNLLQGTATDPSGGYAGMPGSPQPTPLQKSPPPPPIGGFVVAPPLQ